MIRRSLLVVLVVCLAPLATQSVRADTPGGVDITCDVPRSGTPNFRSAASGQTDVKFKLWTAATSGTQLGSDYVVPMTNLAVAKRYTDKYDSVKSRKAMRINAVIGTDGSPVLLPVDGQAWLEVMVGTTTLGCDFAATGDATARRRLQSVAFSRESSHSETCETCTTAPPAADISTRVFRTDSTVLVPNNAETVISWDGEAWDTAGLHDPSVNSSRLTPPSGEGGKYLVFCNTEWNNVAGGFRAVRLRINGGRQIGGQVAEATTALDTFNSVSTVFSFDGGNDYVECVVYQNSGAGLNFVGDSQGQSSAFGMIKLR